ncbi:hypothetical protein QQ965_01425 [Candidatus Saccharibacteria bacterium oral taxon 955]|jgi:hypothetical protein
MSKNRENRMRVDLIDEAVYVDARRRIKDKYYKQIQKMPGADFVVGRNGYSVSVMYAKMYNPEEVAAGIVIIRARAENVDPADVTLEGNIAEETRMEVLRALHKEAELEGCKAAIRLRQAQEDSRWWTERSVWLWKKIRQEEA